jgi:hypothetical protein
LQDSGTDEGRRQPPKHVGEYLRDLLIGIAVAVDVVIGLILMWLGAFAGSTANTYPQDQGLLTLARVLASGGFVVWCIPLVYFAIGGTKATRVAAMMVGVFLLICWLIFMMTMSLDTPVPDYSSAAN